MSRPLRLGIAAPLWMPIPPGTYGGIERHLYLLVEELVRRGHDLTLFASGDSKTSARLHAVVERGVAESMEAGEACYYEHALNAGLAEALRSSCELDLLHYHVGLGAMPLAALADCPVLHTVHIGLAIDDVRMLERFPDTTVTALSHRQVRDVPAPRRERLRVVPYGFDFDSCPVATGARDALVFLGRMAPHKGPDAAIRIAERTGRPLLLAGAPVTREDNDWFDREVRPHVDGRRVSWLGAVGDADKQELFESAAAFLFPISWDEPFGLVMLEALARGVPVLATRRGSVPEVVEAGLTGFVEERAGDLAGRVEEASALDRTQVRERARRRFSVPAMVDGYEAAYAEALAR